MKSPGQPLLLQLALAALVALSVGGCAGRSSAEGGVDGRGGSIGTGSGGAIGVHCTTTSCVPQVSSHLMWAVEIDPSGQSSVAAIEELPGVDLYDVGKPLSLMAAVSAPVGVTFTAPTNGSVPSSANVVLSVPSLIPGRPPLTFQGPTTSSSSTGTSTATLTVPMDRLESVTTMSLVPLPPADQQSPPHSFSVMLVDGLQLDLPGDDLVFLWTLTAAIGPLPSTFVARAFQQGTQVSNAPTTQSNGMFQLVLPSATAAAGTPLTLQLTSQSQADPWFVSNPLSLPPPSSLAIMLPAYSNLNQFNLAVQSADDSTVKISAAVVRAQTTIGTNTVGTTEFARSGTTNANGVASLSLLPGNQNAALSYSITVTPPANSPYASQCAGPFDVRAGGSAVNSPSAPSLTPTPIVLATRPVLIGTVTDGSGYQVANVLVTATPGPLASGACTAASTSPSSTTSDSNGVFALPLDPGTYQLDYDPPSGSSAPRFTEPTPLVVGVSASGTIAHNVQLPAGGLVQGVATSAGGATPLSSATIRIFEPRCTGTDCTTPPWLRGQTVTDGNGNFQVVVPLPQ
jgi:hypothetical protein